MMTLVAFVTASSSVIDRGECVIACFMDLTTGFDCNDIPSLLNKIQTVDISDKIKN